MSDSGIVRRRKYREVWNLGIMCARADVDLDEGMKKRNKECTWYIDQ